MILFFIADKDVIHFVERIERNEFDVMFDEVNVPISNECILIFKGNKRAEYG